MRVRLLSALSVTFVLLSACDGDVTSPDRHKGTYDLETVNGFGLPFLKVETSSERIEVVSGSLSLGTDGTYHGEIVERRLSATSTEFVSAFSNGTFSAAGNQLTFTESGSGAMYFGAVSGGRLSATLVDVTFGFRKR